MLKHKESRCCVERKNKKRNEKDLERHERGREIIVNAFFVKMSRQMTVCKTEFRETGT